MSQLEARFVHQGFWINLEQGPVMGKTLTTDAKTGTIVVALLALLASIATTHLWNITLFLCHQVRADGRQADGLSRQQQVLYRSLPTPSAMVADALKLWWLWKKRTGRVFIRSMTPLVLGAAFSVGLIVIGIFSSYVVDNNGFEVLASSPLCGPLDFDSDSSQFSKQVELLKPWSKDMGAAAQSYANECSRNETTQSQRCAVFKQPYIPFTREHVVCPFARELCVVHRALPAFRTDSGLVDMNHGFGMNLATKDRVKFRRQNTCAVLSLKGRTNIVDSAHLSDDTENRAFLPGEQLLVLHYGNLRFPGSRSPNATFLHSLLTANVSTSYETEVQGKYANPLLDAKLTTFDPIPGLRTNDADLALIRILKNSVLYAGPVDDPLFAAHRPRLSVSRTDNSSVSYYLSDTPSSVSGCLQQYQFCFTRPNASEYCNPIGPLPAKATSDTFPGANGIQLAIFEHLSTSSVFFDMGDAKQSGLKAQVVRGDWAVNKQLPNDQWIQEIIGWETYTWAEFQVAIADYAIGASARESSAAAAIKNTTTPGEKSLCKTQKMKSSGGFVNINVFGLAFIVTFAVIITIFDLVILRFCIFLTGYKHTLSPRINRWIQDGVFQLQRRAHEANGQGVWEGLRNEIPATVDRVKLGDLPLESIPKCADAVLAEHKSAQVSTHSGTNLTIPSERNISPESAQFATNVEERRMTSIASKEGIDEEVIDREVVDGGAVNERAPN